jgi:hypothetical protein
MIDSIFAFLDANNNGAVDLDQAEPLGWYTTQARGPFVPVYVKENSINANMTLTLEASNPFDYQFTRKIGTSKVRIAFTLPKEISPEISERDLSLNGTLRHINGFNVMHLRGDPASRGYAHGALGGKQILDWFR